MHCGTSFGRVKDNDIPIKGLKGETIFEKLDGYNISWLVYGDPIPQSTLLYKKMREPKFLKRQLPFSRFKGDCEKGLLPQYTFIDPNYIKSDNHPPHDLKKGESFVKSVYESIRASPQWNQTLMLLVYDEHGGFYDHVVPPTDIPTPDDSEIQADPESFGDDFKFDRLGVRVPAIFISPWVPKGKVFRSKIKNRYLEHSSVLSVLKRNFGLTRFMTRRDAWATSFHPVTNFLKVPRDDCIKNL